MGSDVRLIGGRGVRRVFLSKSNSSCGTALTTTAFTGGGLKVQMAPMFPIRLDRRVAMFPGGSLIVNVSRRKADATIVRTLSGMERAKVPAVSVAKRCSARVISRTSTGVCMRYNCRSTNSAAGNCATAILALCLFLLRITGGSRKSLGLGRRRVAMCRRQVRGMVLGLPGLLPVYRG